MAPPKYFRNIYEIFKIGWKEIFSGPRAHGPTGPRAHGPTGPRADFFFLAEPSAKRNYFLSLAGWLNKKGRISGYVKHIRYKTPEIWGVFERICLTYPEIRRARLFSFELSSFLQRPYTQKISVCNPTQPVTKRQYRQTHQQITHINTIIII